MELYCRSMVVRLSTMIAMMFCALIGEPLYAQELLNNRSFESPAVSNPGNNIMASIPNWTISNQGNSDPNPFNIVRPTAALCCNNATETPSGGGQQYLDISGTSGQINQNFTLAADGLISFSGWYSVRDSQQNLSGMVIRVRNVSSGQVVASSSVSFTASEPIGLWKQAAVNYLPIVAGTYQFEAFLPNSANFDLASVQFSPPVSVVKTSTAYWDPVTTFGNAKMIPGGIVTYEINITVPADYSLSPDSLTVSDATPANLALLVSDFQGAGSGPAALTPNSSGLALNYSSLSSATDGIDFSHDGGTSWTYSPVVGADGSDPMITHIRVRPTGAMAAGSNAAIKMRYVIK